MKELTAPSRSVFSTPALLLGVIGFLLAGLSAGAAVIVKGTSGKPLDSAPSWIGGVEPTNIDVATWNSTSLGKGLTFSSTSQSWLGINITSALTSIGVVDTGGAGVGLTLGADGITNTAPAGTNFSWGASITLASSQTWWSNPGVTNTITTTAIISGPASFSLAIRGGGLFVFQGANTYSGPTTISDAGTSLTVNSAQTGTNIITVSDGTTFGVAVSGVSQLTPASLILGSSVGPATNEFTGLTSTTLAPISTHALTVNGTTTINILASSLSLGIYPLISYTSIGGTGGFVPGTLPSGVTANIITNASAIALNVTAVTPLVWSGSVNGNWDTTTSNWTFNGSPAYYSDGQPVQFDDTSSVTNVTIAASGGVFPASVLVNNTTKAYTFLTGAGTISGTAGLTKSGTNSLSLAGAIASTGTVTINNGTLLMNGGNNTLPKNVNVVCNGTLDLNNTIEQFANFTGSGSVLAEDFGQLFFGVGTATFTFSGTISDTAGHVSSISLEKGGQGVATLTGISTYTGATFIQKTTLSLGDGTTPGNIGNSSGINMNSAVPSSQCTLLVNYPSGSSNGYAGPITGQGFFVMSGGGTYALSGADTFNSGATTVTGGTLQIDSSLAAGNPVTVQNGGTLSGIGSINEVTSVNAGGEVFPGDAGNIGTLTFGSDLSLSDGAIVAFALNTANPGVTNDELVVTGALNVTNGIATVINAGPALVAGDSFTLLSQPASGFTTVNLPSGYAWTNKLAFDGSIQVLSVTPTAPPGFGPGAIVHLPNGSASVTATGAIGATYKLWASTNILLTPIASTWTLVTNGTITTSPFTITDPSATNYPQRFYLFSAP